MVDYSKWENLEDSDDETPRQFNVKAKEVKEMGLSRDLEEKLMALKDEPGALDRLDEELETMKAAALAQRASGSKNETIASRGLSVQEKIIKQELDALESKRREMDSSLEQLEKLAAAGDSGERADLFMDFSD